MNDWRPSYHIARIMAGHEALEDAPDAIQSAARLPIFQAAQAVLALKDKALCRKALDAYPERIRPHIERQAFRLRKG